MSRDIGRIPIISLSGCKYLTNIITELPLPKSTNVSIKCHSLLSDQKIAQEAYRCINCRNEAIVNTLIIAVNSVINDVQLKDSSLDCSAAFPTCPTLLRAMLKMKPDILSSRASRDVSDLSEVFFTNSLSTTKEPIVSRTETTYKQKIKKLKDKNITYNAVHVAPLKISIKKTCTFEARQNSGRGKTTDNTSEDSRDKTVKYLVNITPNTVDTRNSCGDSLNKVQIPTSESQNDPSCFNISRASKDCTEIKDSSKLISFKTSVSVGSTINTVQDQGDNVLSDFPANNLIDQVSKMEVTSVFYTQSPCKASQSCPGYSISSKCGDLSFKSFGYDTNSFQPRRISDPAWSQIFHSIALFHTYQSTCEPKEGVDKDGGGLFDNWVDAPKLPGSSSLPVPTVANKRVPSGCTSQTFYISSTPVALKEKLPVCVGDELLRNFPRSPFSELSLSSYPTALGKNILVSCQNATSTLTGPTSSIAVSVSVYSGYTQINEPSPTRLFDSDEILSANLSNCGILDEQMSSTPHGLAAYLPRSNQQPHSSATVSVFSGEDAPVISVNSLSPNSAFSPAVDCLDLSSVSPFEISVRSPGLSETIGFSCNDSRAVRSEPRKSVRGSFPSGKPRGGGRRRRTELEELKRWSVIDHANPDIDPKDENLCEVHYSSQNPATNCDFTTTFDISELSPQPAISKKDSLSLRYSDVCNQYGGFTEALVERVKRRRQQREMNSNGSKVSPYNETLRNSCEVSPLSTPSPRRSQSKVTSPSRMRKSPTILKRENKKGIRCSTAKIERKSQTKEDSIDVVTNKYTTQIQSTGSECSLSPHKIVLTPVKFHLPYMSSVPLIDIIHQSPSVLYQKIISSNNCHSHETSLFCGLSRSLAPKCDTDSLNVALSSNNITSVSTLPKVNDQDSHFLDVNLTHGRLLWKDIKSLKSDCCESHSFQKSSYRSSDFSPYLPPLLPLSHYSPGLLHMPSSIDLLEEARSQDHIECNMVATNSLQHCPVNPKNFIEKSSKKDVVLRTRHSFDKLNAEVSANLIICSSEHSYSVKDRTCNIIPRLMNSYSCVEDNDEDSPGITSCCRHDTSFDADSNLDSSEIKSYSGATELDIQKTDDFGSFSPSSLSSVTDKVANIFPDEHKIKYSYQSDCSSSIVLHQFTKRLSKILRRVEELDLLQLAAVVQNKLDAVYKRVFSDQEDSDESCAYNNVSYTLPNSARLIKLEILSLCSDSAKIRHLIYIDVTHENSTKRHMGCQEQSESGKKSIQNGCFAETYVWSNPEWSSSLIGLDCARTALNIIVGPDMARPLLMGDLIESIVSVVRHQLGCLIQNIMRVTSHASQGYKSTVSSGYSTLSHIGYRITHIMILLVNLLRLHPNRFTDNLVINLTSLGMAIHSYSLTSGTSLTDEWKRFILFSQEPLELIIRAENFSEFIDSSSKTLDTYLAILGTLYGQYEAHRKMIVDEIFRTFLSGLDVKRKSASSISSEAEKVTFTSDRRTAKTFRLLSSSYFYDEYYSVKSKTNKSCPIKSKSPQYLYIHTLIRLFQKPFQPFHFIKDEKYVLSSYSTAVRHAHYLLSSLFKRISIHAEYDIRSVLETVTNDLLTVTFHAPIEWPASAVLLNVLSSLLVQQLNETCQNVKNPTNLVASCNTKLCGKLLAVDTLALLIVGLNRGAEIYNLNLPSSSSIQIKNHSDSVEVKDDIVNTNKYQARLIGLLSSPIPLIHHWYFSFCDILQIAAKNDDSNFTGICKQLNLDQSVTYLPELCSKYYDFLLLTANRFHLAAWLHNCNRNASVSNLDTPSKSTKYYSTNSTKNKLNSVKYRHQLLNELALTNLSPSASALGFPFAKQNLSSLDVACMGSPNSSRHLSLRSHSNCICYPSTGWGGSFLAQSISSQRFITYAHMTKLCTNTRFRLVAHAHISAIYLLGAHSILPNFGVLYGFICKLAGESSVPMRSKALHCLSSVIDDDPKLMYIYRDCTYKSVISSSPIFDISNIVRLCLLDNSTAVREAAVDLVSRFLTLRPQFLTEYYSVIVERILDKGVNVRKRVIRFFRDLLLNDWNAFLDAANFNQHSYSLIGSKICTDICLKLVRRIHDDSSIQDAFSEDLHPSGSQIDLACNQIIGRLIVLIKRRIGPLVVPNSKHFSKQDHSMESQSFSILSNMHGLITCLHLVSHSKPNLVCPYIGFLMDLLHKISLSVPRTLSNNNQTGSQMKQTSTQCLYHLINIVEILLTEIAKNIKNSDSPSMEEAMLAGLLTDHSLELREALSTKISTSRISSKTRPSILRALYTVGLICKYFTLDYSFNRNKLALSNSNLLDEVVDTLMLFAEYASVRMHIQTSTTFSGLNNDINSDSANLSYTRSDMNDPDLCRKAITGLGYLLFRHDHLFCTSPVQLFLTRFLSTFHTLSNNHLTDTSSFFEIQRIILDILTDYLLQKKCKATSNNRFRFTRSRHESLVKLTNQGTGHSSAIAQTYLPVVLKYCILTPSTNVRSSALSLISTTLHQGLIHPSHVLSSLICLQTDLDPNIRSRASTCLTETEREIPGFVAIRAVTGIRMSYQLQLLIHPNEFSPLIVRGAKYYKITSERESLSPTNNPTATVLCLNHSLYTMLRSNRHYRRSLIEQSHYTNENEGTQNRLSQLVFIADHLAHFPYVVLDEVYYVADLIERKINLVGSTILQSLCQCLLSTFQNKRLHSEGSKFSRYSVNNGRKFTETDLMDFLDKCEANLPREYDFNTPYVYMETIQSFDNQSSYSSSEKDLQNIFKHCESVALKRNARSSMIYLGPSCLLLMTIRKFMHDHYGVTCSKLKDYLPSGAPKFWDKPIILLEQSDFSGQLMTLSCIVQQYILNPGWNNVSKGPPDHILLRHFLVLRRELMIHKYNSMGEQSVKCASKSSGIIPTIENKMKEDYQVKVKSGECSTALFSLSTSSKHNELNSTECLSSIKHCLEGPFSKTTDRYGKHLGNVSRNHKLVKRKSSKSSLLTSSDEVISDIDLRNKEKYSVDFNPSFSLSKSDKKYISSHSNCFNDSGSVELNSLRRPQEIGSIRGHCLFLKSSPDSSNKPGFQSQIDHLHFETLECDANSESTLLANSASKNNNVAINPKVKQPNIPNCAKQSKKQSASQSHLQETTGTFCSDYRDTGVINHSKTISYHSHSTDSQQSKGPTHTLAPLPPTMMNSTNASHPGKHSIVNKPSKYGCKQPDSASKHEVERVSQHNSISNNIHHTSQGINPKYKSSYKSAHSNKSGGQRLHLKEPQTNKKNFSECWNHEMHQTSSTTKHISPKNVQKMEMSDSGKSEEQLFYLSESSACTSLSSLPTISSADGTFSLFSSSSISHSQIKCEKKRKFI
ncbi:Nipped-B-like protein B [Schistosoma japonicum]|nr:Nipped-B-like protein B [Schistosoma japonicum]